MSQKPNILQLYTQYSYHTNAYLVGTESALRQLRGAIDELLESDEEANKADVFASDGEGYSLIVEKVGPDRAWKLPTSYGHDWGNGGPTAYCSNVEVLKKLHNRTE